MPNTARTARAGTASRRAGYLVAAVVNGVLLYLVNARPGWEAVPFLTGSTTAVLGWVNASLAVSLVANLLYLGYSARWFTALGDLATTAVGLVAVVRVWQVFPFDFGDAAANWGLVARVVLAVAAVGSVVALLAQAVALVRALGGGSR